MLCVVSAALAVTPQGALTEGAPEFSCAVKDVDIVMDQKPEYVADALTIQDIKKHIGDPASLEWVHLGQQFFSDIDGRSEEKILGTPGGDMAEFILALGAYEDETRTQIDQATATGLLMEYLKTMSRFKFYLSTSERAHMNLTASSGCANLDIANPPDDKKAALLEAVVEPTNVGLKHLKFMLLEPAEYQTRRELVEMGIRAYHQVMWNKTFTGSNKMCYMLLKGAPSEKALVNFQSAQHCQDQGLAPLISPATCSATMFVNHPEAVMKFRAELAHFMAQSNKPLAQSLITRMNDKGTIQLYKTVSRLLKSYPIFTVTLK